MSAAHARKSLMKTLRQVTGVRVIPDIGQKVLDPPALVIVPPTLTYDVYSPEPTTATFRVPLVVPADDRSIDRLEELLPAVVQAVYDSEDAAIAGPAEPGSWGTPPLPCYLLTIEVSV
ncbi:MAG: hypothetical protein JOY78_05450 [Pseudonocardia sp.]|nr:hypothetical protein [Pseudonocardia sp.]